LHLRVLTDPAQRLIAFGHLENASLLNAIFGNTDLTLDGIADCANVMRVSRTSITLISNW